MRRPTPHARRSAFTLIEMIVVIGILAVLARVLVETTGSMGRISSTGTATGVLRLEGERALSRIIADLRRSGFQTVDGKDYPYVFTDGVPDNPDFAAHAHAPAPLTAQPNDTDFGPRRSIVLVAPSDLDRDGRPELDADGDGWPELDGDGDGILTDDPADVAALWDPTLNTIHPTTGLVWSHSEISFVVVTAADGTSVLERRVDNNPATARVLARQVERIQFDTPESSGWTIPLGSVRVRIFFRTTDRDGRLIKARNEVTVSLRNG